jgi:hypothetical protein
MALGFGQPLWLHHRSSQEYQVVQAVGHEWLRFWLYLAPPSQRLSSCMDHAGVLQSYAVDAYVLAGLAVKLHELLLLAGGFCMGPGLLAS